MIYKVHYEPKENKGINGLLDTDQYNKLVAEIEQTDLPNSEKQFLKQAATRFIRFNYSNIADYYTNASSNMKDWIEKLHLVVVDYDNAIENGYIEYFEGLQQIVGDIVGE